MTEQAIVTVGETVPAISRDLGQAANQAAAKSAFADYQSRKATNTLRRQRADLDLFARYLAEVGKGSAPTGEALATAPETWCGVTWGLVEGFARWMLRQGYAIGSVNVRLSTVKTYSKMAAKAGALDRQELAMIRLVEGYPHKEAKRIDDRRAEAEIPTRVGAKKAESVSLTADQVEALKEQPDTPQGRRDRVVMCLLLDLGLRVGELARLTVGDVDLEAKALRFYRPKVDKIQTHDLINGSFGAVRSWLQTDAPAIGPLLRSSRKGGELTDAGMTERAITERVRYLGGRIGVKGLSAHDLRHCWATTAARNGTALDRLMDAGGWASSAMPLRYIQAAKIANMGVRLA